MLKAAKIRIYPTTEQAALLARQFGAVRFCYNTGLRIMSHRYKRHGQSLSAKHDIKKLLPVAREPQAQAAGAIPHEEGQRQSGQGTVTRRQGA